MDHVGVGRPVKVHCLQRWQSVSTLNETGGGAELGEIESARARAVGEGQDVLLEDIRKEYVDLNFREVGGRRWVTWRREM